MARRHVVPRRRPRRGRGGRAVRPPAQRSTLEIGDAVCAAAPIGLFFGRIANFINGELFGRVSDVPWAVVFPHGGPEPRHPSQLYEAGLEGLVLFGIMTWFAWRPREPDSDGRLAGIFLIGYGVARIVRRAVPRARSAPRVPHRRAHHGPAAVAADDRDRAIWWCAAMAGRAVLSQLSGLSVSLPRRSGATGRSVARFMSLALHHPTSGYYSRRDPLGPQGDFVTAPSSEPGIRRGDRGMARPGWLDLGRPAPFRLVELGPGRGTLLADACAPRAASRVSTTACAFTSSRPASGCGRRRRLGSPDSA